ncbi:proline-specific pep [Pseudovirgaria hyperparasitica]|uniref:Proline-specific pep n=1 Tax=Pseudovirgaria hyperparasitica TaxID=470096 RepID=A0A6A6W1M8_9PEZI|nr:proline-specific pep [Pseudovirgaria hyperparasitica]KAF2756443.1 proline-specific pep [Pseudovirgaria hyperparasitica]
MERSEFEHIQDFKDSQPLLEESEPVSRSQKAFKLSWNTIFTTLTGLYILISAPFIIWLLRNRIPQTYSPAARILSYSRQPLYFGEEKKYTGVPEDVDDAWDNLLAPMNIRATKKELEQARADFGEDNVLLTDGDYVSVLSVYHELHCLNALRMNIYHDHYYPNMTEDEFKYNIEHMTHCVDTIRRSLMCKADVALYSAYWIGDQYTFPSKELQSNSDTVGYIITLLQSSASLNIHLRRPSTMMVSNTEGIASFAVPGLDKPCETWYKVVGDLASPKTPLIILHGGPGACHDYLLPLSDIASHFPLVFYDQIGNGKSTHLPSKAGDEAFWSVDLFRAELDNLLEHLGISDRTIDVYGHSWGGMLAVEWAAKSPSAVRLRRLVISNSLASMTGWRQGMSHLRSQMPADLQAVLDRGEQEENFETPEYEAAMDVFYQRHFSLARPWPCKEVSVALEWFGKDMTTYGTIHRPAQHANRETFRYGPSELYISGSLRDWTSVAFLPDIKAPTLLINGAQDEAQDVAMQPFFDLIPKVKWVKLDNAAHFSHVDQRDRYMQELVQFLDVQ